MGGGGVDEWCVWGVGAWTSGVCGGGGYAFVLWRCGSLGRSIGAGALMEGAVCGGWVRAGDVLHQRPPEGRRQTTDGAGVPRGAT